MDAAPGPEATADISTFQTLGCHYMNRMKTYCFMFTLVWNFFPSLNAPEQFCGLKNVSIATMVSRKWVKFRCLAELFL